MGTGAASYFLGVDGGGTGCRVAIADARGDRIGEASGGSANFSTDPSGTVRNILEAIQRAGTAAGLSDAWQQDCSAHLGLAGVMDSYDADFVAAAMPFGRVTVTDDRATYLHGALRGRNGVLCAIGTGTIVAAQSGGRIRYFGGWGHHLADQASGGWLGRAALRRTMLAHDGVTDASPMTTALLAHFDGNPNDIVRFAQDAGPGDYAAFAPVVVEAARQNDPMALALMTQGAAYLASCIEKTDMGRENVLCLTGGVGPHYQHYLDAALRKRVSPPLGTAVDGAILLAKQQLETGDPS